MDCEKDEKKMVLPDGLQKSMMKFFLKTSIPRKAKQERMKTALSREKGQE